jgi:hypothetical protein
VPPTSSDMLPPLSLCGIPYEGTAGQQIDGTSSSASAQRAAAKAEKKRLKALKPEGKRTESLRLFQADSIPVGLRYRVCERCKENKDANAKLLKFPIEPSALPPPTSPKQHKAGTSDTLKFPVEEGKEASGEANLSSNPLDKDDDDVEKEECEKGKATLHSSTPTSISHGAAGAGVKIEESTTQNPSVTGLHCARCPSSYHVACALESGSGSSPSSSESKEAWTCFKCR